MRRVNLLAPPFDPDTLRDSHGPRRAHVGQAIDAEQLGATLYALSAGERSAPYHFHHGNEEWLLVLAGSPTLRTPGGERTLAGGDVVCLPVGPAGLHEISGPGTVLVVSTRQEPDVVERPDDGTVELRPSGRVLPVADAAAVGPRTASGPIDVHRVGVVPEQPVPAGYGVRSARLGPALGAASLGGTVYELDPGDSICPYHYEGVEEEWLLVLDGAPTLRDPEGEHGLAAGDVACFPAGPEGAHKVTNRSDGVVRVLMLSAIPRNEISICVYPDSEKVGIWPPGKLLRTTETLGYWDGEA